MAQTVLAEMLVLLALLGLAVSTYFLLIYYRVIRADSAGVPRFCRLTERTCESVVFTRDGRLLLGLPNSLFGLLYYLALLGSALARLLTGCFPLLHLLLGAALATVALGAYLTWSLLVKLRIPCPLCLASHGMNLVITVLLLAVRS